MAMSKQIALVFAAAVIVGVFAGWLHLRDGNFAGASAAWLSAAIWGGLAMTFYRRERSREFRSNVVLFALLHGLVVLVLFEDPTVGCTSWAMCAAVARSMLAV